MKVRIHKMKISIDKLYRYSNSNNIALLGSSNNSDFWSVYKSYYTVYDRYFRDHFLSWLYWLEFEDDTTTADIYTDFITAVNSHLAINGKRYSELYRVQVLAADAYDIVNNYDLTESHSTTRSESSSDTSGARQDGTSTTTVDGARSDSGSTTVGAAVNTSEKEFAGFNSSGYNDADKTTDNIGTHTDTTSVTKGSQTNTNNTTLNKGSQSDSHSGSSSESISIRRTGNIGVQTAADVIGGHVDLWTAFNFYKMIFDEIAKEYLMIE